MAFLPWLLPWDGSFSRHFYFYSLDFSLSLLMSTPCYVSLVMVGNPGECIYALIYLFSLWLLTPVPCGPHIHIILILLSFPPILIAPMVSSASIPLSPCLCHIGACLLEQVTQTQNTSKIYVKTWNHIGIMWFLFLIFSSFIYSHFTHIYPLFYLLLVLLWLFLCFHYLRQ